MRFQNHQHPPRRMMWRIVMVLTGSLSLLVAACTDAGGPGQVAPRQVGWMTFPTVRPAVALPSAEECAQRVRRSPWEPRPENRAANHSTPTQVWIPHWKGLNDRANSGLRPRINGRFTGTTDEILQWASCKWGIDTDVVRAMAVRESNWVQSLKGDYTFDASRCLPGDTLPCPSSFGLMQIKHYDHPGTYPASLRDTAFNVDYALGRLRACYEGWISYFGGDYRPGDLWGCVGTHFSGAWKDPAAKEYSADVQDFFRAKSWRGWLG